MLNAFTDEEKTKLTSLHNGGGTTERLSTIRTLDLVLDGSEQVIAFDSAQTSRSEGITTNLDGTFTINIDGYYTGSLSIFVDKSGGGAVDISIWVETKPFATGVYELTSPAMANPIVFDDGGHPIAFIGLIDALAGDEFRIKILKNSGTATLTTVSNAVALGTVNSYAASLSVYKIGPVTV